MKKFRDLLNEAMGQSFLPTNTDNYQLLTLTKPEDVVRIGARTKWSTATGHLKPTQRQYQEALKMAQFYMQKGPIYIVLKNEKPYLQMASGHPMIVDANDIVLNQAGPSLRRFLQNAVDRGQITDQKLVDSIEKITAMPAGLLDVDDDEEPNPGQGPQPSART